MLSTLHHDVSVDVVGTIILYLDLVLALLQGSWRSSALVYKTLFGTRSRIIDAPLVGSTASSSSSGRPRSVLFCLTLTFSLHVS